VIKAGATTVNIPDTVGYTTPEEYAAFMRTLIETGAELRQGGLLGALPHNDSRHGGGEFAGRHRRRRAGRSNAPSTASASGQAMPRSRKS